MGYAFKVLKLPEVASPSPRKPIPVWGLMARRLGMLNPASFDCPPCRRITLPTHRHVLYRMLKDFWGDAPEPEVCLSVLLFHSSHATPITQKPARTDIAQAGLFSTGKTGNRDSINAKSLGRRGVGLGRRKPFSRKVLPPYLYSPLLPSASISLRGRSSRVRPCHDEVLHDGGQRGHLDGPSPVVRFLITPSSG